MSRPNLLRGLAIVTGLVAALSLAPSFAHVLEAAPRLREWPPELWRETTVFHGQFRLFAVVGAPLDVLAVALPACLAFALRGAGRPMRWAALAALLYGAALISWLLLVAPANEVLATWKPGPLPADFAAASWRWESGHMVVAALKAIGLIGLLNALVNLPPHKPAKG
jgi:hypothetical protein